MLITFGRGPKLVLGVTLLFSFLTVLFLSSSSSLAQWKLPTPSSWTRPPTSDPPEANVPPGDHDSWEPVEDEEPPAASQISTQPYVPQPSPNYPPHDIDNANTDSTDLPCQGLQGGEDVLVVMRTGATETEDKLPVHFDTTFQCYPNLVIFSDYEENFRGYQIHDVLKNMPEEIKNTREDFKHYLHIQEVGRAGLDPSELSGAVSEETGDGTGKGDNAGWRLDKWKFLPMINETFALHPDKKWYVFLEPDSYLVWSNLLQWLPNLDPDKGSYFGSEVGAGDITFAHGGSVFLLTRPAVKAVADAFNNETQDLLKFTEGHWAGDAVLGKTLNDNGVSLTFTWPQFQGGNPTYTLDWEGSKGSSVLWCTPALSYHHLIPSEIAGIFQFEQGWIEDVRERLVYKRSSSWPSDTQTLLHHKDVFQYYIMPNLTKERDDWDAKADNQHPLTGDYQLSGCREICEADPNCMQYTLNSEGCATGVSKDPKVVRLGQPSKGFQSGWITERVQEWVKKMDQCSKTGWTTP